MTFLDTCDKLRIIVLILPPHSTHRLQPLDVSLFQPLATAYSRNITDIMQKSGGAINLTKRMFWSCFKDAWEKSFTAKNIKSGFSKCGLWPCDPTRVITIIAPRPNTPPDAELIQKSLKTPKSPKAICQFQRSYRQNPTQEKLIKLFRANEALAAEALIQQFRAKGLEEALVLEKKKRQHGKRLGLTGKEVKGTQFFGVEEIQKAREFQANKDMEIMREKEAKEKAKLERVIGRRVAEKEKEEKAMWRQIDAQIRCDIAAKAQADKLAAKLA
jgi:hypothetical protein